MSWRPLVLAAALAAGCNWELHRMQEEPGCRTGKATQLLPGGACNLAPPAGIVAFQPRPAAEAAPPVTRAVIERGRERFDIYCAPCHGLAGDGDSYVARAMTLRRPPSLVGDDGKQMTDQHLLTVMASGFGVMPSYSSLVSQRDQNAIVYYIRVLQQRDVELAKLPPATRQQVERWLP